MLKLNSCATRHIGRPTQSTGSSLPQGPGLGVTLNEDVIKAHPPTAGHFSLFVEDWQKRQAT